MQLKISAVKRWSAVQSVRNSSFFEITIKRLPLKTAGKQWNRQWNSRQWMDRQWMTKQWLKRFSKANTICQTLFTHSNWLFDEVDAWMRITRIHHPDRQHAYRPVPKRYPLPALYIGTLHRYCAPLQYEPRTKGRMQTSEAKIRLIK